MYLTVVTRGRYKNAPSSVRIVSGSFFVPICLTLTFGRQLKNADILTFMMCRINRALKSQCGRKENIAVL